MTTITAALYDTPLLGTVVARLGHWVSAVSWAMEFSGKANDLVRTYENLNLRSDADLAELGLTREGLARDVFGDLLQTGR